MQIMHMLLKTPAFPSEGRKSVLFEKALTPL